MDLDEEENVRSNKVDIKILGLFKKIKFLIENGYNENDDFKTETSWSKFINKFVPDKVMTSLKSESNYEKLVLYMTGNSFMKTLMM